MSHSELQDQRFLRRIYSFNDFTLDLMRACLVHAGREVKLRPKSFETLVYLVEHNNRLVSKEELMQAVWPETFVTDDSLVQCLRDVRRALEDKQQHLVKTVARRGYIFDAEVIWHTEAMPSAVFSEQVEGVKVVIEETSEHSTEGEGSREITGAVAQPDSIGVLWYRRLISRKALAFLLPVIGLAVALFYIQLSGGKKQAGLKPQVRSIAVLPFKPLAKDGSDEYLGLGMADTLITKLSGLRQVIVRPTSAIRGYVAPDQDALAAGREQRVDAVLEGSIQRSGNRLRVTVRLMDVRDGAPLWAYQCDEHFLDIFAVQDSISERVVKALALELTGEERNHLAKRYTDNSEAYQLYIQGVFFRDQLTEESLKKSIDFFEKAADLAPGYALAYSGQASSYSPLAYLGYMPLREAESRMRPLVTRALQLDETLAEAHTSLGELKTFVDWDWEGAEREFKRAIELKPNEQLAHHLNAGLLMAMGRFEEALAKRKKALEIDPLSSRTGAMLGRDYFLMGRYDQAIEQYNKAREFFPGQGNLDLGPSYERKGMYDQAIKEYLDKETRSGRHEQEVNALKQAYVVSGWRGYWQKRLDLSLAEVRRKPVQAVILAEIYTRLGQKDQALAWLERAYEDRNMSLIFLKVDPVWEGLRSEDRFKELLRRMRLAT